jgi:hypothetical protein
MDLMHKEEEECWMFNDLMNFPGVEKCQFYRCMVQFVGNDQDNVKPHNHDSNENSQQHNGRMDESLDETGCYQNCLTESDGDVEHIVKPCNQYLDASTCYRIMHLKSENERLKSSIICRNCKVHQVETLYLPCCHIVCCESCADAAHLCVLCEERILGTVRIYMA